MEDLTIRYSVMEDLSYLKKWLHHKEVLQWFPFTTSQEVENVSRNWISFSRYRLSLTGMIKNKPVAIGTLFLMPYKKVAHQCTFYLIVDPEWRKQGIGTAMVKNLINLAKNYFHKEIVYMEVFEGCPIITLLRRFDFQEVAYQEKFVKEKGQYRARLVFLFFTKDFQI
ncbi:MAG: GNAT family N-acetyltransferase [Parachlamydiales bacterium]|nr:GNAT family N-acetyltransferase [Parachlamydiales bacterium]